jgi:hypothetical protein
MGKSLAENYAEAALQLLRQYGEKPAPSSDPFGQVSIVPSGQRPGHLLQIVCAELTSSDVAQIQQRIVSGTPTGVRVSPLSQGTDPYVRFRALVHAV